MRLMGIEIGGTKLQVGVGVPGQGELLEIVRRDVRPEAGAEGILQDLEDSVPELCARHQVDAIGVGFGGPVDVDSGVTTISHQIRGWENVPLRALLVDWGNRPAFVDNDCNVAALAEALLGAGQGARRVFYVTVGTGVGGGWVVDGKLAGVGRPALAEIGHLRPGTDARSPTQTVESLASGWGIAEGVRESVRRTAGRQQDCISLMEMCDGDLPSLTTKAIGQAAAAGNEIAQAGVERATRALGWAIAQVVTLLAPERIVVGGGVSLMGDAFFEPLKRHADAYVFPPLTESFTIEPARLGEEVVLHGGIQLAASCLDEG